MALASPERLKQTLRVQFDGEMASPRPPLLTRTMPRFRAC
jgi:hypothetical protein